VALGDVDGDGDLTRHWRLVGQHPLFLNDGSGLPVSRSGARP
jgi:hypothetical protein